MKPAICGVCGKCAIDKNSSKQGDWVEFSNYREEFSANITHPEGLEYFCDEHLSVAINFSNMDSHEALEKLKLLYPVQHTIPDEKNLKRSWWEKLIK